MNDKVIFKSGKNYRLTFAIYAGIVFTIIMGVMGCIFLVIENDLFDFLMGLCITAGFWIISLFIYFISEITCNQKYVVTADEVIKYKEKNSFKDTQGKHQWLDI